MGTESKAELSGASISSTSLAIATASMLGLDWKRKRQAWHYISWYTLMAVIEQSHVAMML